MTDKDGTRALWQPMGEDSAGDIEINLNGYLTEAGLGPRPAGFRWFPVIPDGWNPTTSPVRRSKRR